MRRLVLLAASVAVVGALLLPGSALAGRTGPSVPLRGEFLDTFSGGTATLPADTPFYVENGWCGYAGERTLLLNPGTYAGISLDGEPLVMGTIVDMDFTDYPLCLYGKFNYHNFIHGLPAGTYTFQASFYWDGVWQGTANPLTLTVY
jgi:hypothetical protein